jgi:tetratricopeptide (TPR) repeat protein
MQGKRYNGSSFAKRSAMTSKVLIATLIAICIITGCRRHIAESNAGVVVGPYPVKNDIENLKSHDVVKIVSLLDPSNPYEDTLLLREEYYAKQAGIAIQNYPMPVDSMNPNFQTTADAAASGVASNNGKIYLHSYLTSTRTLAVEKLLNQKGIATTVYILPRKAGAELTYALDSAEAAYQSSHFHDVQRILGNRTDLDRRAQLVLAWATYHLGQTDQAKHEFDSVLRAHKDDDEANIGHAYCDYREKNLHEADSLFSFEISKHADDPSANAGLGLVRYEENKLEDARRYLSVSLRTDSINVEAGTLLLRIDSMLRTPATTARLH